MPWTFWIFVKCRWLRKWSQTTRLGHLNIYMLDPEIQVVEKLDFCPTHRRYVYMKKYTPNCLSKHTNHPANWIIGCREWCLLVTHQAAESTTKTDGLQALQALVACPDRMKTHQLTIVCVCRPTEGEHTRHRWFRATQIAILHGGFDVCGGIT